MYNTLCFINIVFTESIVICFGVRSGDFFCTKYYLRRWLYKKRFVFSSSLQILKFKEIVIMVSTKEYKNSFLSTNKKGYAQKNFFFNIVLFDIVYGYACCDVCRW